MSKKTLIECNGCGKEELEENTKGWISASFKVGREVEEADLCSFACVGRYGVRREKERNPDN